MRRRSCWPGSNVSIPGAGGKRMRRTRIRKLLCLFGALALPLAVTAEPLWVGRFSASDATIPAPWKIEHLDQRVRRLNMGCANGTA
jgi:hypothetical protein